MAQTGLRALPAKSAQVPKCSRRRDRTPETGYIESPPPPAPGLPLLLVAGPAPPGAPPAMPEEHAPSCTKTVTSSAAKTRILICRTPLDVGGGHPTQLRHPGPSVYSAAPYSLSKSTETGRSYPRATGFGRCRCVANSGDAGRVRRNKIASSEDRGQRKQQDGNWIEYVCYSPGLPYERRTRLLSRGRSARERPRHIKKRRARPGDENHRQLCWKSYAFDGSALRSDRVSRSSDSSSRNADPAAAAAYASSLAEAISPT